MNIQKPTDRETWEGEIATYWFDDNTCFSFKKYFENCGKYLIKCETCKIYY